MCSYLLQHVTAEGTTLVKQAEDAAEKRDVVGLQEQALKEAFEIFCKKGVAGSSSAKLPATFCDNILKKFGKGIYFADLVSKSAQYCFADKKNLVGQGLMKVNSSGVKRGKESSS
ncbi:unnamed protein product [Lactuca virosa]|uniref:Poly [ADP-ribose] polymerase n=1 Tax=Lactuca virosa TaxID=75947 RepID=A0AAU9MMS4_9ASTR|nr:unnamed protein product [Lactuca virosa]